MASSPYDTVLKTAAELPLAEQLRLVAELAERVSSQLKAQAPRSILELSALGRETWRGINPDEYIDRERAAWNG